MCVICLLVGMVQAGGWGVRRSIERGGAYALEDAEAQSAWARCVRACEGLAL